MSKIDIALTNFFRFSTEEANRIMNHPMINKLRYKDYKELAKMLKALQPKYESYSYYEIYQILLSYTEVEQIIEILAENSRDKYRITQWVNKIDIIKSAKEEDRKCLVEFNDGKCYTDAIDLLNVVFSNIPEIKKTVIGIKWPACLETIESNSLQEFENLEYCEFPEYMKFIDSYIFENCRKIKRVVMPVYVDTLNKNVFPKVDYHIEIVYTKIYRVKNAKGLFMKY